MCFNQHTNLSACVVCNILLRVCIYRAGVGFSGARQSGALMSVATSGHASRLIIHALLSLQMFP